MSKKIVKIFLVLVLLIIVILGVLYFIDMNRINNNEPVLFSTWGKDYTTPVQNQEEKESDKKNQNDDLKDINLLKSQDWSYVSESGITDEMAFLEDITEEVFNTIGNNLQPLLDEIALKETEDPNFIIEGKWFDYFKNDERYLNVLELEDKALKPLYFIIYKSENQGLYEYICSFAMYDILKLQNSDYDFEWSTSKDYLNEITKIIVEIKK